MALEPEAEGYGYLTQEIVGLPHLSFVGLGGWSFFAEPRMARASGRAIFSRGEEKRGSEESAQISSRERRRNGGMRALLSIGVMLPCLVRGPLLRRAAMADVPHVGYPHSNPKRRFSSRWYCVPSQSNLTFSIFVGYVNLDMVVSVC